MVRIARIKNIRVISEIRGKKVSPSNQRAHAAERISSGTAGLGHPTCQPRRLTAVAWSVWFGDPRLINQGQISGQTSHDLVVTAGLATALQNYNHGRHGLHGLKTSASSAKSVVKKSLHKTSVPTSPNAEDHRPP